MLRRAVGRRASSRPRRRRAAFCRPRCRQSWRGCFRVHRRSAVALDGLGVVMAMLTVVTVITSTKRFCGWDKNGRAEANRPCPENCSQARLIPRRQIRRAKSFGMKWNETAFWKVCKLLKTWWPGTDLNRRRQPFQGCQLKDLQATVYENTRLRRERFGLHLDSRGPTGAVWTPRGLRRTGMSLAI